MQHDNCEEKFIWLTAKNLIHIRFCTIYSPNLEDSHIEVKCSILLSKLQLNLYTLLVKGDLGISIFRKQFLRKVPFTTSLIAAFIKGKQSTTASLKSVSWLSSFFLHQNKVVTVLNHNLQLENTIQTGYN